MSASLPQLLAIAGVPATLHEEALQALADARQRAQGLLWHKLKVRLLKADKIARAMLWEAERLIDVRPDWARWDVAPMRNITGHGDNVPWIETPQGGRPVVGAWLNPDPESDEYREAVKANYWCRGEHPRSRKSRMAWYRRNGGEYEAWARGCAIDTAQPCQEWRGESGSLSVQVVRWGNAWIVSTTKRYGPLRITGRYGFECDNALGWFPLPGYDLRAPATWGWRLRIK